MLVNAPIPLERQLAVVDLALEVPGEVVDLGCGEGALALELARRGHAVVGVDLDARALAHARSRSGERAASAAEPRFVEADASEFDLSAQDLVVSVGALHAFGDGPEALTRLLAKVRASGSRHVLLGLGFHSPPFPAEYEAFLGTRAGIERTHAENVWDAEAAGFRCLHATTASLGEWDAFEWAHFRTRGRTEWRDAYLRWGRGVMGFGLYLLERAG